MAARELPLLNLRAGTVGIPMAEMRHRRPVGPLRLVGAGVGAALVQRGQKTSWTSFVPGAAFSVAILVYAVTGVLCIAFPPEATSVFDEHVIPDTASCLRVSRHTNYAAVDLIVGTPPTLHSLLLRMDRIKGANDTALRLFSNRVAESDSVSCVGTICTDVVLLHPTGPSSPQISSVVQFEYNNPTTESLTYGTAVTLSLDGEFFFKQGYDYFLTATHLCWSIVSEAPPGAMAARISGSLLVTDATELQQTSTMSATPAGQAQVQGYCYAGGGEVALFPSAAADEATWLGLASERAYETSPDGVDDRRAVVEVGTTCASNHSSYERANSLYELDCLSVYVNCENNPSVPYRRVAADQLRIHIPDDGSDTVRVFTSPDSRLAALPKMGEGGHVMYLAFLKLGLMTLAAAVTWIRANKSTASLDRLFMFCLRMAHCPVLNHNSLDGTAVLEDATIGLIAAATRIGVAIWRITTLAVDGQLRAPVAQLVAGILSVGQWVTRYIILDRHCETPLTKLGGSTALIDATCAVMMGFAEPPLLVSAIGRFDPTARLLTAMLVTTMTLQRCLFASACCGLLWAVASDDVNKPIDIGAGVGLRSIGMAAEASHRFSAAYVPIILAGLVAWFLQTASVAILLADVFCVPLAHSMSRSVAYGWGELAMAIFMATAAAGMPTMLRTLQYIAQDAISKNPGETE